MKSLTFLGNVKMNKDTKRRVILSLLDGTLFKYILFDKSHQSLGMENHLEEQVMVRNCCLSLCQVKDKTQNTNNSFSFSVRYSTGDLIQLWSSRQSTG
jgi:hypothetical protein